jgi:hypothetical protein
MIEPVAKDIGREVLYTGNRSRDRAVKIGIITSFDLHCVYVRYGQHTTSEGNRRQDLEWHRDGPTGHPDTN